MNNPSHPDEDNHDHPSDEDVLDDPRWEQLAMGTLPEHEIAQLKAWAERSEEAQRAFEIFRPLDDMEKAKLKTKLLEKGNAPPPARPKPKLRRLGTGIAIFSVAAAAAALALWWPKPPVPPAKIALYTAHVEAGAAHDREPKPNAIPTLRRMEKLVISLKPEANISAQPGLRAFLGRGGMLQPWSVPTPTFYPNGTVELSGKRDALFAGLPEGYWDLVIVLGTSESLPSDAAMVLDAERNPKADARIQVFRIRVKLEGEAVGQGNEPLLLVEYAGCAAVRSGPVCELPASGALRLWIKAKKDAPFTLKLDDKPVDIKTDNNPSGTLIPLLVSPSSRMISIETLSTATPAQKSVFHLPLTPLESDPALDEAKRLRGEGKLKEAASRSASLHQNPRIVIRARAHALSARLELAQGQFSNASDLFYQSIKLHHETGLVSEEIADRLALAYTNIFSAPTLSNVRSILEDAEPLAPDAPELGAMIPHYWATLHMETGRVREALLEADECIQRSTRLDMSNQILDAAQLRANALYTLGRSEEATALLHEHLKGLSEDRNACSKALILQSIGWIGRKRDPQASTANLQAAVELYRKSCGEKVLELTSALTNLAITELEQGQFNDARAHLDEAKKLHPEPSRFLQIWWGLTDGRLTLAEGQAQQALSLVDDIGKLGEDGSLDDGRVELYLVRAAALEALKRYGDAETAYNQAEDLLDSRSILLPNERSVNDGVSFFDRNEQSTHARVAFLLRRAEAERNAEKARVLLRKAADAARRGRARRIATLQIIQRFEQLDEQSQKEWETHIAAYRKAKADIEALHERREKPGDALKKKAADTLAQAYALLGPRRDLKSEIPSTPPPGELILFYYPLPSDKLQPSPSANIQWLGFAITNEDIVIHKLSGVNVLAWSQPLDADRQAEAAANASKSLLLPFQGIIEKAKRLRIIAAGPMGQVDIHSLPFGQEQKPLITRLPVTYGVDLPHSTGAEPSLPSKPAKGAKALVVVNPTGYNDLQYVNNEATLVSDTLQKQLGQNVIRWDGDQAFPLRVAGTLAMEDVLFFHFAGHGAIEPGESYSKLLFAGGSSFGVPDTLTLKHVPPNVILSACKSAVNKNQRRAPSSIVEEVGLPQAFIAAGAKVVVVASRNISDQRTLELMTELYGSNAELLYSDLPMAFQKAQSSMWERLPRVDWGAFRVYVP